MTQFRSIAKRVESVMQEICLTGLYIIG